MTSKPQLFSTSPSVSELLKVMCYRPVRPAERPKVHFLSIFLLLSLSKDSLPVTLGPHHANKEQTICGGILFDESTEVKFRTRNRKWYLILWLSLELHSVLSFTGSSSLIDIYSF